MDCENPSYMHVHKPIVPGVKYRYGTSDVAHHYLVWRVVSLADKAGWHDEFLETGSSMEVERKLDDLMRSATVDWICLVTISPDAGIDDPGEIAEMASACVYQGRQVYPHQKAFRFVPDELIEVDGDG